MHWQPFQVAHQMGDNNGWSLKESEQSPIVGPTPPYIRLISDTFILGSSLHFRNFLVTVVPGLLFVKSIQIYYVEELPIKLSKEIKRGSGARKTSKMLGKSCKFELFVWYLLGVVKKLTSVWSDGFDKCNKNYQSRPSLKNRVEMKQF